MPPRGRTGFARAAVFVLRHGEATGIPVHFATPVPQERLPSVPGSKEFADLFGKLQAELEPENERAGRRPARSDVSEENP